MLNVTTHLSGTYFLYFMALSQKFGYKLDNMEDYDLLQIVLSNVS